MSDRPSDLTPLPLVEWRVVGCRHRVLRVFLARAGWRIDGDDFTVTLSDWIARQDPDGSTMLDGAPFTPDAYRAGRFAATQPKVVAGLDATLPLEIEEWPDDGRGIEIGCRCGKTSVRPLADLAADCRTARTTRKHPVVRRIEHAC